MTISFKRYVDIVSGVGGTAAVAQRELIGMIFTDSLRVPSDGVLEFNSAAEVAQFFGTGSAEYNRAAVYFNFVSKNITSPRKLAFCRYFSASSAPSIFGTETRISLDTWKAVLNSGFNITVRGTTEEITGLDFSDAATLADVASIIQAALLATGEADISSSVVTYDPVRYTFDLNSGVNSAGDISISISQTGTNILPYLGWDIGVILVPGGTQETPLAAFIRAAERNNNFGSFTFLPAITADQIVEVATANSGRNVEFMFSVRVTDTNMDEISSRVIDLSGVILTYAPVALEYDELAPMILLASTDYSRRNSSQNYVFQQFAFSAKVTDDQKANTLDDLRVNYMGVTQTAGQLIKFYQRGVMCGLNTAPTDANTYANEMWFKDRAGADIMSLLLAVSRVPANNDGKGQIIAMLQGAIDAALYNGTISVGKELTRTQKLSISEISGVDDAWIQVQNIGFWLDCDILPYATTDGRQEYRAAYTLIYSKDDAIRKVDGRHVLI